MKYKLFKLLSFEEQKEYDHNNKNQELNLVVILSLAYLTFLHYLYGLTGFFTLFTGIILIIIGVVYVKGLLDEWKFKGIAKRKEKSLKGLNHAA